MFRAIKRTITLVYQSQLSPVAPKYLANVSRNNAIQLKTIRCYSAVANQIDEWLSTLNEAENEKIKFIRNEISFQELEGKKMPKVDSLTVSDYTHMLSMSNNQRHKYYSYLHSLHYKRHSSDMKKEVRGQLLAHYNSNAKPSAEIYERSLGKEKYRQYGLGYNCLYPKFYKRTLNALMNRNVFRQMILNKSKIIYDLGFYNEMTARENLEAARQLTFIVGNNRRHKSPFVMHFCNFTQDNVMRKHLSYMIPNITKQPLHLNEEDYIDALPKERLVVLTPDSPNILKEYNSNDHYVISAIVDRGDQKPLSLSKAKELGVRTARLPIEHYRSMRANNVLTLDQVHNVMLEVKASKDWNKAFQYITPRKFK